MRKTLYDYLEVSKTASYPIIEAAYKAKKVRLQEEAPTSVDAKNELIIIEDAWRRLSNPEARKQYDSKIAGYDDKGGALNRDPSENVFEFEYSSPSAFNTWWEMSKTSKLLIGLAAFGLAFAGYKFSEQSSRYKVEERKAKVEEIRVLGSVSNDGLRAENERKSVEGQVINQGKYIDRSYEIAKQDQERRARELDSRTSASNQMLEMQRQKLEMQQQQEKWAQEQYEKDRVRREAENVHRKNKIQLCGIYAANRQNALWQQEGCAYVR